VTLFVLALSLLMPPARFFKAGKVKDVAVFVLVVMLVAHWRVLKVTVPKVLVLMSIFPADNIPLKLALAPPVFPVMATLPLTE